MCRVNSYKANYIIIIIQFFIIYVPSQQLRSQLQNNNKNNIREVLGSILGRNTDSPD
jgi:hypothetical protein